MRSATLLELKAVLKSGGRFGHEAGGIDGAVSEAAAVGEMSLEFLPVSLVVAVESHTCHSKKTDPRGNAEDGQHLPLVGVTTLCGGENKVQSNEFLL